MQLPDVKLPSVEMPNISLPKVSGPAVGTPTEVYTRVARGAMLCWFGGNGPLKGKYIYHANAESPSAGGRAEIGIHAIDKEQPSPVGGRVYHITIEPIAERANMTVENVRIGEPLATQMREDAQRWAASEDDVACRDEAIAKGWDPKATSPAAPGAPASAAKPAKKATAVKTP